MKRLLLTACGVFAMCVITFAQTRQITGKITNASNQGVASATLKVKNAKVVGVSKEDGQFSVNIPTGKVVLEVSSIGYGSKDVTVGANETTVNVVLAAQDGQLGEVVVTALGISKEKKALGYATTTIKSEDITIAGSPNFATALYGKAPGVTIGATPGGATSAVNISIRGLSSITGKTQPLIVMNGVPIRNGEASNNDYWSDQRIRGNGLLDINPEDIDNISILKGASAAALYGSEAVNGVVLITTKSGVKGKKGLGVDFSANMGVDNVAYLPRYQNVRGAGMLNKTVADLGTDDAGFVYYTVNGVKIRALPQASINFGAPFDGQPILTWDGVVRPYVAQKDNYKSLFQQGKNSSATVAVSHASDVANIRFSLTHQRNEGLSIGSLNEKNIANLNASFKVAKNFTTDVMVNYINQYTHNRPYSIDRLMNNFAGMIGIFDNGQWYQDKVITSKGYRYREGSDQSATPAENLIYSNRRGDLLDYMYRVKAYSYDERSNRVIGSITNTWQIVKGLKFRSRVSTDFTSMKIEDKQISAVPLSIGNSGYFGMSSSESIINYTDALLTYTKKLNDDLELNATGGYTATKETYSGLSRGTNGGLSTENLFDIAASVNTPGSGSSRSSLVKDAFLGTLNASYKNYLFAEATVRRDRTSTMNPNNNTFVYPSANASFIFSDALSLPTAISYGKLRASWGIVGNYPSAYSANVAYNQNTLGTQGGSSPILYTTVPTGTFGNESIKPEQKNEIELGLEMRFFKNRFGLDLAYYNAQVKDQILPLTLPPTSGAGSILTNIGTLRNQGVELSLNGTILEKKGLKWEATLNLAKNANKVEALAPGLTRLLHADYDGNAAQLVSEVGQPMGDLLAHPILTNAKGEKVVGSDGIYLVDPNSMVKVGNAMPKLTGGLNNTFTYKNFALEVMVDFRYGGHVMPTAINWMTSRGLTEESLTGMDAAHGGLQYTRNGKTYNDGLLFEGVKQDGSKNDIIVSQAKYYWDVYNWGGPQYSPTTRYELYIKENSYIKMREMSLGYTFGSKIAAKIGANKLRLSVYGRNLFYLYRTLKDLDAEQTTAGSRWYQNVNNVGTNPSSRSFGIMLRASF